MLTRLSKLLPTKRYLNSANSIYFGLASADMDFYPDPKKEAKLKKMLDVYQHEVCYSNLPRSLKDSHKFIYTHMKFEDKLKDLLDKDEMVRWFKLAKENKLLPEDFDPEAALQYEGYVVGTFEIEKVKTMPLLYIYLSTLRYVKEMPAFARIVVNLVDKRNMDFFVALTVAAYFAGNNTGHSIFPIGPGYPGTGAYTKHSYNLKYSRALRILVNDAYPKAVKGKTKIVNNAAWNMHQSLSEIDNVDFNNKFSSLKNKTINKYIYKEEENVEGKQSKASAKSKK